MWCTNYTKQFLYCNNIVFHETIEWEAQLKGTSNISIIYYWCKQDFHNTVIEINPEHLKWEENLPADWDGCVHKDMQQHWILPCFVYYGDSIWMTPRYIKAAGAQFQLCSITLCLKHFMPIIPVSTASYCSSVRPIHALNYNPRGQTISLVPRPRRLCGDNSETLWQKWPIN